RRINTEAAAGIHPQVAAEAARGHQLAGLLGVISLSYVERREFRPDQLQEPRAMGLLPHLLLGVVADDVASAPLAFANVDLFHPQIGGDIAVSAWPREHIERPLRDLAHWHCEDVPPQSAA